MSAIASSIQEIAGCPICFNDFETSDDTVKCKSTVAHIFHRTCAEAWVARVSRDEPVRCPICQGYNLVMESDGTEETPAEFQESPQEQAAVPVAITKRKTKKKISDTVARMRSRQFWL